jgi:hypothetical protein
LTNLIKKAFSIIPDRSNRFFNLKIVLKDTVPVSCNYLTNNAEIVMESHNKILKEAEDKGAILSAFKMKDNLTYFYIFQSKNEV